jgi:hypothetical protein
MRSTALRCSRGVRVEFWFDLGGASLPIWRYQGRIAIFYGGVHLPQFLLDGYTDVHVALPEHLPTTGLELLHQGAAEIVDTAQGEAALVGPEQPARLLPDLLDAHDPVDLAVLAKAGGKKAVAQLTELNGCHSTSTPRPQEGVRNSPG